MNDRRSRARIARPLAAAAALLALVVPASARADAVADWNLHATNALIVGAGQTPTVSVLHLAMAHGAVYDAVNAIDRRHEPYLVAPPAMPWDSKDAAAATAAYRVLASLLPEQQPSLASLYEAALAAIPSDATKDGGIYAGEVAAAAMLSARANDGRFGSFRFTVGSAPGVWRPVTPAFVNDPFAWVKDVQPFLIPNPSGFGSEGPYAVTSPEYAREFGEVKALGSATSTARTRAQTEAAVFWSGHPPETWSRIVRSLSTDRGLSTADSARLFGYTHATVCVCSSGDCRS